MVGSSRGRDHETPRDRAAQRLVLTRRPRARCSFVPTGGARLRHRRADDFYRGAGCRTQLKQRKTTPLAPCTPASVAAFSSEQTRCTACDCSTRVCDCSTRCARLQHPARRSTGGVGFRTDRLVRPNTTGHALVRDQTLRRRPIAGSRCSRTPASTPTTHVTCRRSTSHTPGPGRDAEGRAYGRTFPSMMQFKCPPRDGDPLSAPQWAEGRAKLAASDLHQPHRRHQPSPVRLGLPPLPRVPDEHAWPSSNRPPR